MSREDRLRIGTGFYTQEKIKNRRMLRDCIHVTRGIPAEMGGRPKPMLAASAVGAWWRYFSRWPMSN